MNQDTSTRGELAAESFADPTPWLIETVPVWREFMPDQESLESALDDLRSGLKTVTVKGRWLPREPYPGCDGEVSYDLSWVGVDHDIPKWECIDADVPDMEDPE